MKNKEHKFKSEIRVDSTDKVRGKALYGADINIHEAYNVFVYRADKHHAIIKDIDISQALSCEGIKKIVLAKDIPGEKIFGPVSVDKPVLAFDRVRQMGDPIGLVIAKRKDLAQKAANEIKVEYEELPAIFDPEEALLPSAPKIQPNGNLVVRFDLSRGNIKNGFKESDIIIEEVFSVQRVSPGYLEPEVSTAKWMDDGVLKVWSNSQMPFEVQDDISKVLDISKEQIKVVVPSIGGSFGGKSDSTISILAALAAYLIKGTVRIVNTREESMIAHPKRHPGKLRYKFGAKKDGTFTALEANFVFDTGAYASYGSAVGGISAEMAAGPYRTPHVSVTSKIAYTNTPFGGSIRGVGGPQTSFACESLVDIMAAKLEIDPIEIRLKNMWKENDETYFGVKIEREPSLRKCLQIAKTERQRLRTINSTKGKYSGIGVASSILKMGMGYGIPDDSKTRIEWIANGSVDVWVGSPDLGQGLKTISTQIVAEVLELSIEKINLVPIDTNNSPYSGPTNTSRSTMLIGNSLMDASKNAISELLIFASADLGVEPSLLKYKNGRVIFDSPNSEDIPFEMFSKKAAENGKIIRGNGLASFPVPSSTPKNLPNGLPHVLYCYGSHVVRVEVDPVFGTVDVKDYIAIHDVGKAINPMSVEGQIEGGVVMGIGYALMEDISLRPNGTWVDNLTEYIMPTISDVPEIKSIIVEETDPNGPFGAIGLGEPVAVAIAPAIANAIYNATGKRVLSLPITPDKII